MSGWRTWWPDETGWCHVEPEDDVVEHEIEGDGCICGPEFDFEFRTIVHQSFDRREDREKAEA